MMKYIITMTGLLAALTACKTTQSQLQDDVYFPLAGKDHVGYLTWVVGTKTDKTDDRHICRAYCTEDPARKAGELGKAKINDVRAGCNRDTARSVSFAMLNSSKSEYQGVVAASDMARAKGNQDSLRNTTAVSSGGKTLAGLLFDWQDSITTSGVLRAPTSGPKMTSINEERHAVIETLFSDDGMLYLPTSIASQRDQHNKAIETQVERGYLAKTALETDTFKIPEGTVRHAPTCFTKQVTGTATQSSQDKVAKSGETKKAPAKTALSNVETSAQLSNPIAINNKVVYGFIKSMLQKGIASGPSTELDITVDGKTAKHLVKKEAGIIKVLDQSRNGALALTIIRESDARTGVSKVIFKNAGGEDVATIPSEDFNAVINVWFGLYKIGENSIKVTGYKSNKMDEKGWNYFNAAVPQKGSSNITRFRLAYVRIKPTPTGGQLEIHNDKKGHQGRYTAAGGK